jgi:hypothetical protein
MTPAQNFADQIKKSPVGVYFDEISDESYGVSYTFDGYIPCHVVMKSGWFYDVQDAGHGPDDYADFPRFGSMEDLVKSMVEVLSVPPEKRV